MTHPDIHALAADHEIVASVSGGKDSAAMCLHLRDLGIPYRAVFMDTGWEARETYDYLRDVLDARIGPITWLRAEVALPPEKEAMAAELEAMLGHYSAMVRICLKKVMLPARQVRWCTQAAKVEPMYRYLDGLDADTVSVVGVRAAESAARAKMEEWEWNEARDCWTWRPLLRWSEDEVIAIHRRHDLPPNPLYLRGASRVGCWPCIFARKEEIRAVAEHDPGRVAVIRRLEAMIAGLYADAAAGSASLRAGLVYKPPTWFQHNSQRTEAMRTTGYAWPIDRVVEWSLTSRGGRQFELFAAGPSEAGCVRWGVCETAPEAEP